MKFQAVVFDMDGLLLDTEPLYRLVSQRAAIEFEVNFSDGLFERLIGRNRADVNSELKLAFGADFPLQEFRNRWAEHWDRALSAADIVVKAGVGSLLSKLEDLQTPFAIATSTHRQRTENLLAATGLAVRFGTVVTGDEVERGKPAPDIYLQAAERLSVRPERCIALEDSDSGVLAAAAAGMHTIVVPDMKAPSRSAAAAASHVCRDLNEASSVILPLLSGGKG